MNRFLVAALLMLASSAHADERFRVHPTSGWFATSDKPCGQETRDQISEVVSAVPTLIIDATSEGTRMQVLRTGKPTLVSYETIAPTSSDASMYAWFRWGTKRLVIKRHHQVKAKAPQIELTLIRSLDEITCHETWAGLAEVK